MDAVLTRTGWATFVAAPTLLLGAACAPSDDADRGPAGQAGDAAPTAEADSGDGSAAGADALPAATARDAEEITAVTHTFVTGDNNGDAAMLGRALCRQTLAEIDTDGLGPSARPQVLTGIDRIEMLDGPGGDAAIGQVSFTYVDDPGAAPTTVPLAYLREDGVWTVCTR